MTGPRLLDSSTGRPVKLGKYELTEALLKDPKEQWAIVQEVGVGYWFGRMTDWDKQNRIVTLDPGLVLSSLPRTVAAFPSPGEPIVGVITGDDMKGVLGRRAFHPIRDMAYSHYELACEFDTDFQHFCFLMAALASGAKKKEDVERELSPRVQPATSKILPQ